MIQARDAPEGIDSLNADRLKTWCCRCWRGSTTFFKQNRNLSEQNNSLQARIDELLKQISALLARITGLEASAGKPPKTPTNSSLPPSSRQKANVENKTSRKKKCRKGRPGVARELCPNRDVTRAFFAERCVCGGKEPIKGQVLAHAYDHFETLPIALDDTEQLVQG